MRRGKIRVEMKLVNWMFELEDFTRCIMGIGLYVSIKGSLTTIQAGVSAKSILDSFTTFSGWSVGEGLWMRHLWRRGGEMIVLHYMEFVEKF
jgi:hypothetical protein